MLSTCWWFFKHGTPKEVVSRCITKAFCFPQWGVGTIMGPLILLYNGVRWCHGECHVFFTMGNAPVFTWAIPVMMSVIDHVPYGGIDWLASLFTFLCMHYVGENQPKGFLLGMMGNILWVIFGVLTNGWGLLLGNVILFVLNGKGYWRWKKQR